MLFSLEAQRLFLRLPSRWRNITFHSERAKKMWPRHSIALAEPRSKISWSYLSLFHSALCHCDCDCIKHVFVMIKARAPRERRKIVLMQFGTTKSTQGTNGRIWQSKIFEWTSDILWRHLCICLIDCILFLLVCACAYACARFGKGKNQCSWLMRMRSRELIREPHKLVIGINPL